MIYLKQVKLLDPDLVTGNPEELKHPYKAPAVRFAESKHTRFTPKSYPKFPHAYGANDEGTAWITSTGLPQTNYSYIRIRKS